MTARARATEARRVLQAWFDAQGWTPLPFQKAAWKAYLDGKSGLIHTPTGSGKTLAAFGGPLLEALAQPHQIGATKSSSRVATRPLRVVWITPLRALASDTTRALSELSEQLGVPWIVAQRTGDASSRDKRLARAGKVDVLVTTPESLSLLLTYEDTATSLRDLECVIVDEWHELLGSKRGTQTQLVLARLRALSPRMRTWGLSATLGHLDAACRALLPIGETGEVISGAKPRPMTLETLLPDESRRFPWGGHLGLGQLENVLAKVFTQRTTLLFTNTRSQAELWHQALAAVWPEDEHTLALHHGSMDPGLRQNVEAGLREGALRCVVATSSLDLGVDFPTVDQVIQLGSAKGVGRLVQRAGRARHRPGETGHVVCVPTHALELAEYAAARHAIAAGHIEARHPPRLPIDVLAQHCVTLALGGGFDAEALLAEVRRTDAFHALDDATWTRVIDFVVRGGDALEHYPEYRRVVRDDDGIYRLHDRRAALRHRLSIGTITSDGSVSVKLLRGGGLGAVEESFLGRLRPGDRFRFSGKLLELVRLEHMTAYVRVTKQGEGIVPRWMGGRMPLSNQLSWHLERAIAFDRSSKEMHAIAPLLDLQEEISDVPHPDSLIVEVIKRRDGQHVFFHVYAGRSVNEAIANLFAWRLAQRHPNTFSVAYSDHGFMLSPQVPLQLEPADLAALMDVEHLSDDLRQSANLGELARRQFRGIARIAGLLPPSLPGRAPRSMRQLQASSGLLYDVLQQHDPGHLLLQLAAREAVEEDLQLDRMEEVLANLSRRALHLREVSTLTPLSFPLWADGMRAQMSTEDWQTRVQRAAQQLEKRYGR